MCSRDDENRGRHTMTMTKKEENDDEDGGSKRQVQER